MWEDFLKLMPPTNQIATFLAFLLLSGLGWLCDFGTFSFLVKLTETPSFVANFISSYVGVTFVWFTSLKTVFLRQGSPRQLGLYWGYQFFSILLYSQALHFLIQMLMRVELPVLIASNLDIVSKCMITPLNLVTNFMFMKYLTRQMQGS
ncbi:hypothetical protein E2K99_02775 [Herbaspirillum huttiense]|uniref:GtrA family protein n=1 Tax=Herbaspirillum huttiense TaxID=863372 RepID=UPI0010664FD5|nr:GtrA family protein [Herbaspirillum huttiense]QBP74002.1 hypothetical protein E2K99_02775 [Herbaspirillum huttiense]